MFPTPDADSITRTRYRHAGRGLEHEGGAIWAASKSSSRSTSSSFRSCRWRPAPGLHGGLGRERGAPRRRPAPDRPPGRARRLPAARRRGRGRGRAARRRPGVPGRARRSTTAPRSRRCCRPPESQRRAGSFRVGAAPAHAIRRRGRRHHAHGLAGVVVASVPLDAKLVAALRSHAGLAPADRLAIVEHGDVVAAAPPLHGTLVLTPGRTLRPRSTACATARSSRRRSPAHRRVVRRAHAAVARSTPPTRPRATACSSACSAPPSRRARRVPRGPLHRAHAARDSREAARAIARGRLAERVPVRGSRRVRDARGRLQRDGRPARVRGSPSSKAERARLRDAVRALRRGALGDARRRHSCAVVVETALEATGAVGGAAPRRRRRRVRPATRTPSASCIELPLMIGGSTQRGQLDARRRPSTSEQRRPRRLSPRTRRSRSRTRGCTGSSSGRPSSTGSPASPTAAAARTRSRTRSRARAGSARRSRSSSPTSTTSRRVNDVHGHAVGDDVLREFAAVLREHAARVRRRRPLGRRGVRPPPARDRGRGRRPARRARPAPPSPSARSSAGTGPSPGHLQLRRGSTRPTSGRTRSSSRPPTAPSTEAKRRGQEPGRACGGDPELLVVSNGKAGPKRGYDPRPGGARPIGRNAMPVETPSLFAQVIKDHLELKEKNSHARRPHADRPLQGGRSVREPSAVQDRGAGAHRGDDGRRARLRRRDQASALARRRDRGERGAPPTSTTPSPTDSGPSIAPATSTGATDSATLARRFGVSLCSAERAAAEPAPSWSCGEGLCCADGGAFGLPARCSGLH